MTEIQMEQTLAEKVVALLIEKGLTVSTAESCTGGMVAATLIDVPGVSKVFKSGHITYSNKSKHKLLGVKTSSLEEYGAVSKTVAKEMAKGETKVSKTDVAVSTTGIAGPGGGTEEKPVGLVYIGCCICGKTTVKKCNFTGERREIREASVEAALSLMYECLVNYDDTCN